MNYTLCPPVLGKITISALGLVAVCAKAEARTKTKKPNIIFLFSDDQKYASMGITGDPVTKTPNMDALAKDGVIFDKAYITTPISGPSRANIFTGQWERKNHIGFSSVSKNSISEETFNNSFLMQLKNIGYSTAFIGKHHTNIVDREELPLRNNIDFCYYGKGHLGFYPAKRHKQFSNLKNSTQIEGFYEAMEAYLKQGDEYDYFYENADASIKNQVKRRDTDKPFVVWMNFNLPHASSLGGMGSGANDPSFYRDLYADKLDEIPLPEGYPAPITLPNNVFAESDLMKYYKTANKPKLLSEMVKMNRAVHGIDLFVGKMMNLLKELGEDDNTIIIYCSDNGLFHGEHGLGGKTMLYEEGSHVPMWVHSPFLDKKLRGKRYDQFVVGQDIPATILDMCGVSIPDSYQGESMMPIINGKNVKLRDYLFTENLFTQQGYPRQEAVRGEKYKYIRFFSRENDRDKYIPLASVQGEKPIYELLFDLENDPKEQNNLAEDSKYKKILEEYRVRCQEMVTYYSK